MLGFGLYVTSSIYSDWLLLLPNCSSHCVCIIIQKQGLVKAHRSQVDKPPRADSGRQESTGEVDTSYHVEQFEATWNNMNAKFFNVFKQNARTLFLTYKPLHFKCVFLFQIFKVLYLKQNASWGRPQTTGCLPGTTACFKKYLTLETGPDAHIAVECHRFSATCINNIFGT